MTIQFNTKQNHEIHGENVINGKLGKYREGNEILDQILIQKERLQYISEKMSNIAKEFWYKAIFFEGETRGNAGYGLSGGLKMINDNDDNNGYLVITSDQRKRRQW